MATRYYITLPDGAKARGSDPSLAFHAHSAEGFAEELQNALTGDALFERWRVMQDDPDEVDPSLAAVDPDTTVVGEQDHMRINLVVLSRIPGTVLKHRLRLLAGQAWELRDVTAG